jgi:hypothetical protein
MLVIEPAIWALDHHCGAAAENLEMVKRTEHSGIAGLAHACRIDQCLSNFVFRSSVGDVIKACCTLLNDDKAMTLSLIGPTVPSVSSLLALLILSLSVSHLSWPTTGQVIHSCVCQKCVKGLNSWLILRFRVLR